MFSCIIVVCGSRSALSFAKVYFTLVRMELNGDDIVKEMRKGVMSIPLYTMIRSSAIQQRKVKLKGSHRNTLNKAMNVTVPSSQNTKGSEDALFRPLRRSGSNNNPIRFSLSC